MSKYQRLGDSTGRLVDEKQVAYGDSFGRSGAVLRELYPDGIKPAQYDDVLCLTRILDKLFRIANKKGAFEENPYRDIVGYALLGMGRGITEIKDCDPISAPTHIRRGAIPPGTKSDTHMFSIPIDLHGERFTVDGWSMFDGVALDFGVDSYTGSAGVKYDGSTPRIDEAVESALLQQMKDGTW